jgi:hypothetical protein
VPVPPARKVTIVRGLSAGRFVSDSLGGGSRASFRDTPVSESHESRARGISRTIGPDSCPHQSLVNHPTLLPRRRRASVLGGVARNRWFLAANQKYREVVVPTRTSYAKRRRLHMISKGSVEILRIR